MASISHLSVDPVLGGDSKDTARITLQQRVTGNLFVTFAAMLRELNTKPSSWNIRQLRGFLSGVRDQNGGFAVDGRIQGVVSTAVRELRQFNSRNQLIRA